MKPNRYINVIFHIVKSKQYIKTHTFIFVSNLNWEQFQNTTYPNQPWLSTVFFPNPVYHQIQNQVLPSPNNTRKCFNDFKYFQNQTKHLNSEKNQTKPIPTERAVWKATQTQKQNKRKTSLKQYSRFVTECKAII